jgi:hypothetical protein
MYIDRTHETLGGDRQTTEHVVTRNTLHQIFQVLERGPNASSLTGISNTRRSQLLGQSTSRNGWKNAMKPRVANQAIRRGLDAAVASQAKGSSGRTDPKVVRDRRVAARKSSPSRGVSDIIIIIITFTRESPEGCRHASPIPARGICPCPAGSFGLV